MPADTFRVDHLRLHSPAPDPTPAPAGGGRVLDPGDPGRGRHDGVKLALAGPAWLILGEGYNRGWRASCDGKSLGEPLPVDGYANGWQVERGCREASFSFSPGMTARWLGLLSALVCLALAVAAAAAPAGAHGSQPRTARGRGSRGALAAGQGRSWRARWRARCSGAIFALRAGVVLGPLVALVLWRGVPARTLALAAGVLLAVVVPAIYVLFPPRDLGGWNTDYAKELLGAHWVGAAALTLLTLALWRVAQAERAAAPGEPGRPRRRRGYPQALVAAPTVSLVLPAYNEARRIPALLDVLRIERAGDDLASVGLELVEVVIVDDGSVDGTAALLRREAARDPRLHAVTLARNRGKGGAVAAGVAAAQGELQPDRRRGPVDPPLGDRQAARARSTGAATSPSARAPSIPRSSSARPTASGWAAATTCWSGCSPASPTATRSAASSWRPHGWRAPLLEGQLIERYAFDVETLMRARAAGYSVVEVPVVWIEEPDSSVGPAHRLADGHRHLLARLAAARAGRPAPHRARRRRRAHPRPSTERREPAAGRRAGRGRVAAALEKRLGADRAQSRPCAP